MEVLRGDGVLRIVGEGGAGKSAVLRRLCERFGTPVLVLKDDRVDGRAWTAFAGQLGVTLSADEVVVEFASRGPCLLAIDGADRLLLSERRPVVEDLLAAISASPLRDRWSIVVSARDFQSRDLAADALAAAGLPAGRRLVVAGVEIEDVQTIGWALPALAAVASRSDLGDRNRILFLLR
jgi:ABC-type hemin transport system ATPase subunit